MTGQKMTAALLLLVLAGCTDGNAPPPQESQVDASGKEAAELSEVPADVLAVAQAARPDLEIKEAEFETRDGREYYDVEGVLPDGSEFEIDMTRIDGEWTAVEFQRDIEFALVPDEVAALLATSFPGWEPHRIIESTQLDDAIIYEFFGPGEDDSTVKQEIRWHESTAELLVEEWAH